MKGQIMDKFTKITVGFVTQVFEEDDKGRFVCTDQQFIAGDQCDYEDAQGNPIEPQEHQYQPFNMTMLSKDEIIARLDDVLISIDAGGEQSKRFADGIKILRKVLGYFQPDDDVFSEAQRRSYLKDKLRRLSIEAEGINPHFSQAH